MTAEQLAQGRALKAKASPGPVTRPHPWIIRFAGCSDPATPGCLPTVECKLGHLADAAYIEWLLNNGPELIAAAELADREHEGWKRCEQHHSWMIHPDAECPACKIAALESALAKEREQAERVRAEVEWWAEMLPDPDMDEREASTVALVVKRFSAALAADEERGT